MNIQNEIPNFFTESNYDDEHAFNQDVMQWSVAGDKFFPAGNTVKKLPRGYYEIGYDTRNGEFFSKKEKY